MRAIFVALALLPSALWADDIPLEAKVSAVTLYPLGATVVREAPFSAQAGSHQLIVTDLPRSTPLASVRVALEGAVMGAISTRRDFVPPRSAEEDAALAAARAEVARIEAALREKEAEVETIRLEARAAQAKVAFLEALGKADNIAALDVAALRSLVGAIGQETLASLREAQDARRRAAEADRRLAGLRDELKRARQALEALVPEEQERAMLAVAIRSDAPAEGTLRISYTIQDAGWQPVYDLRLDRRQARLDVDRAALVWQRTGENWRDVAMTLSTARPGDSIAPGEIRPWLRRIHDPENPVLRPYMQAGPKVGATADAMRERVEFAPEPVIAQPRHEGLTVSYDYPERVSVASGADNLRLALGRLHLSAEIVAQAVPLVDDTAFLMAHVTNDSGEVILPTREASLYLDDLFIGRHDLGMIAAGDDAELAFGPVDGLRLTRIVVSRSEGDRGMISRANELIEEVRIGIRNLTGESWRLRVLDRVPYSEQENLEITWRAVPPPSETDVDGRRGILAWRFDLPAGQTREITLRHSLQWPEGMVLE